MDFNYTIDENATKADAVDLGSEYKVIGIQCPDCSNIPASTSMTVQIAFDTGSAMHNLYEQDNPSTLWSIGSLPTSSSLAFILTHAFGARKIRLILSNAASGGAVVFRIFGVP